MKTQDLITATLRDRCHAFSLNEICTVHDAFSREMLRALLEKISIGSITGSTGEVVQIEIPSEGVCFVHAEQFLPLLFRSLESARPKIEQLLTEAIVRGLKKKSFDPFRNREYAVDWLDSDLAFERFLKSKVRKEAPLLAALLRYHLLIASISCRPDDPLAADALSLIDQCNARVQPWHENLSFFREALYESARRQAPFWARIPLFGYCVRLLRG